MADCTTCVDASKNTGRQYDGKPFGAVNGIFAAAMEANDGTPFEIDCSVVHDQAWLDGKLNEPDPTKRLYVVQGIEEPTSEAPVRQERVYTSTRRQFLGLGNRSVSLLVPGTTSQYYGQLKNLGACRKVGFYYFDECGKIKGNSKKKPGFVLPTELADGSYSAILNWAVDASNTQDTELSYDHAKNEVDEDQGFISDASYTFDLFGAEGLTDISIENLAATASNDTITLDVKTMFGDVCNLNGVPGLLDADFTITVNAIGTTIDTLTDNGNGSYSIVTTADILVTEDVVVTITKTGLETATANVAAAA